MSVNVNPFLKVGTTSKVAADTTAPSGVQCAGDTKQVGTMDLRQYRVQNNSTETVFYAYGANATVAQTNAVIPTNATVGGNSMPLSAGAIEVISAPIGQYWSAITVTAAAALYVTPGKGV